MYDKLGKEVVRQKNSSQNKNKSYQETISVKNAKKPIPGRRHSINSTPINNQTNTHHNYNSASYAKNSQTNNIQSLNGTIIKQKSQDNEKDSPNNLKTPAFLYQFQYEVENRRMTLEMIK
jgi:hypothetical protein